MGYIRMSTDIEPRKPISIEADLDFEEASEFVRRLKDAVSRLQQKKSQESSDTDATYRVQATEGNRLKEVPEQTVISAKDEFSFPRGKTQEFTTPSVRKIAQPVQKESRKSQQNGLGPQSSNSTKPSNGSSISQVNNFTNQDGNARPQEEHSQDASSPTWRQIWKSEPGEHDHNTITNLAYVPVIEGLSGGTSHGGWLLSASNQLLNLWECIPGKGDASLQVMHSQATDFEHMSLSAEPKTKTLFATCKERSREFCVSLQSTSSDSMLAFRGKLPLPPKGISKTFKGSPPLKVTSLHGFGGPLMNCIATSYGEQVSIFSVTPVHALKTVWQAHNSPVTQIHGSQYSIDLFTADQEGSVSRWELRAKPRTPADTYPGLTREVTGLHQISENKLLGTSLDGKILTWDVRKSKQPVISAILPDKEGVDVANFSPEQGLFAVASTSGQIYTFGEHENSIKLNTVEQRGKFSGVKGLLWNSRTLQLYSLDKSSVVVYSRDS